MFYQSLRSLAWIFCETLLAKGGKIQKDQESFAQRPAKHLKPKQNPHGPGPKRTNLSVATPRPAQRASYLATQSFVGCPLSQPRQPRRAPFPAPYILYIPIFQAFFFFFFFLSLILVAFPLSPFPSLRCASLFGLSPFNGHSFHQASSLLVDASEDLQACFTFGLTFVTLLPRSFPWNAFLHSFSSFQHGAFVSASSSGC